MQWNMNIMIKITPMAWKKIKEKVDASNGKYINLVVGLKSKGCSGHSYTFELTDRSPECGERYIKHHDIGVIVDINADVALSNATLDWVQKDQFNQGFDVINEREIGRCGCGESVILKL